MVDKKLLSKKLCVIIPCYNEEKSIGKVIADFKKAAPEVKVYVYDNNSEDDTKIIASKAGADVVSVPRQGKGFVIQEMFRDINADLFVLVDGDFTYKADDLVRMLNTMQIDNSDMVVGNRLGSYSDSQSRTGHFAGNVLITQSINYLFGSNLKDALSGYRIFTRRFVKSAPIFGKGFEIETILTIHGIEIGAKISEVNISYDSRIEGSESKLNTYKDGFRIGWTILRLFTDYRPIVMYGSFGLTLAFVGFGIGTPVVFEYLNSGLVPRFPSAILAGSLVTLGVISIFTGIILSAISKTRREIKKLAFLSIQP